LTIKIVVGDYKGI